MTNTSSSALSRSVWAQNLVHLIRGIILVAICSAIIAAAAKAKIPLPSPDVPTTLQSLAVMAIAAFFGSSIAVTSVIAYLLEGAFGLPVFTNTPPLIPDFTYFFGPTGGFLIGFVALAGIVGEAADRRWNRNPLKLLIVLVLGEVALFALGFVWLAYYAHLASGSTGLGQQVAFQSFVVPFLPYEAAKVVIVALVAPAFFWALSRFRKS